VLVRAAFEGRDPIGRSITFPELARGRGPVADPTFEVVGVLRDVRNAGIRERATPEPIVPSTIWPATCARSSRGPRQIPALMLETVRRKGSHFA